VVYGWRVGAEWGFFAPLYSLAGSQNRTYFDLSDSLSCCGLASATEGSTTPVDTVRPVWSVDLVAPRYGELLRITGAVS
jgi:hypothetical protein